MNKWTYAYNTSKGAIVVTDPMGNSVAHGFSIVSYTNEPGYENYTAYYDSNNTLLKSVQIVPTTYPYLSTSNISPYGAPGTLGTLPEKTITTLVNGAVSEQCVIRDNNTNTNCAGIDGIQPSGQVYYDPNYSRMYPNAPTQYYSLVVGSELYSYNYDYGINGGAGSLLGETVNTYEWQTNPAYQNAGFLNLVASSTVLGPTGSQVASTTYGYDEANGSPTGVFGHQTSVTRWLSGGKSPTSQTVYNSQGMPVTIIDANNNPTGITYDSTGAYLKTVTEPSTHGIQHFDQYSYDPNTGMEASHTDENNQTTTYSYDLMQRLTSTLYPPGGGSETYQYNDTPPNDSFTYNKVINANENYTLCGSVDALGRKTRTTVTSDPYGYVYTDTAYNGIGQLASVSNPYRSVMDVTSGLTSYIYDGLGRTIIQTKPDHSVLQWCYNGVASSTLQTICSSNKSSLPNASWVDTANETGKHWQHASDGLGRLVAAMEPDPVTNALALETDYSYDSLNNLQIVSQRGKSTDSPRTRSFQYDSLSRLLISSNPETGTICYGLWSGTSCMNGYDPDGNLLFKTDARGVVKGYTYDALNRLTSKSYSDGITPTSCFQYDAPGVTNGKGRLANAWTQQSSSVCTGSQQGGFVPVAGQYLSLRAISVYDEMGRLMNEQQSTPASLASGLIYAPAYTYDLAGDLVTSTDGTTPSPTTPGTPLTFTNTFDGVGRLSTVVSNWSDAASHPGTLFSTQAGTTTCPNSTSTAYTPFGALMNATFGNGPMANVYTLNRSFDNRLRTTCEIDTGSGVIP